MEHKPVFSHEKLIAYQTALEFMIRVSKIIERLPSKLSACDQLERSSTSAVLNIAEGNGKSSLKDRKRYFEIAHGSELESASCLDVLYVKKLISKDEMIEGKLLFKRGVDTLDGLIRNHEKRINSS